MDVLVLSYYSADDRNKTQNGSKLYLGQIPTLEAEKENYVF